MKYSFLEILLLALFVAAITMAAGLASLEAGGYLDGRRPRPSCGCGRASASARHEAGPTDPDRSRSNHRTP
jgi:hypothetical protein